MSTSALGHLRRAAATIAVLALAACGSTGPDQASSGPTAPGVPAQQTASAPPAEPSTPTAVPQGPGLGGADGAGQPPAAGSSDAEPAPEDDVARPQDGRLDITMVDIAFVPDRIEIPAGEPVQLTVTNTGQLEHDLDLAATGLHVHGYPGTQQTGLLQIDQPGVYEALCVQPGHADAGMVMEVVVR